MDTQAFWKAYVGVETPADFMLRHQTDDPRIAARAHVLTLPQLFGIVLREQWAITFRQTNQLNREEVIASLVACLESFRPDWEEAVAGYAVPAESRFAPLAEDKVGEFLAEEIIFRGVDPGRYQNGDLDQNRAFKEMPLPKSTWFEESVKAKILVNVPTDQEMETQMLRKRGGVSNEVIEKYAALVQDEEDEEDGA